MDLSILSAVSGREELWRLAWEVRKAHFAPRIGFDRPTATIAVSVTGTACALRCAHCNGHYLAGMRQLGEPAYQGKARATEGCRE